MKYSHLFQCFFVSSLIGLLCLSCKKDVPVVTVVNNRSVDQLVKDSVYHYYKLYSLWTDATGHNAQTISSFTDAYDSPYGVLTALKGMTPFFAGYHGGIDRFSYLEDLGAGISEDLSSGYGLLMSIGAVNKELAYPIVYLVEGGSAAALAGIKRSDIILGIDEFTDLGIPVSCNAGCNVLSQNTYQYVVNTLLLAMERKSMKIRLRHSDGSEAEVTLTSGLYAIDPVVKDKVLIYPQKNIGYLALSSFEDVKAGQVNRQKLIEVFDRFEQHGITELVMDLRYNSGGYVSAAAFIANKIINAGADGALMYKYGLNAYLSQHTNLRKESFDDVYFDRNNSLNINTVYFLVTNATASAAELLINVLKPYMNVILIAENEGTYGKPVGFFKQEIMGKTTLWAASFKLINARGETDYYNGISAERKQVVDDIFHDFGDEEETMLATALRLAQVGVAAVSNKRKINIVNAVMQKNMLY